MVAQRLNLAAWHEHRWVNRLQSVALLVVMGGLLAVLGWLLWGPAGSVALLLLGALGVAINPATSPAWVMRLYGAERLDPDTAPGLWRGLAALADRAGLPAAPELYYLSSGMLNAFAVGSPRRSAIGITDGLLRRLNDRELLGVLAHEISHVASNDLWVMGLADVFSRITTFMSLTGQLLLLFNLPLLLMGMATINWWAILLLILAPNLSALAQLALSRTREYDADLNAAYLTGDPAGLASALLKIERLQGHWVENILLPGRKVPDPSLLRTHPHTEDRIARLAALDPAAGTRRQASLLPLANPRLRDTPAGQPPRWRVSGLWH